jgi:Na+-driven multidrug efflux pump
MALFIARQGTIAAASHQVASTLAALVYMMPLSLGIASSARVSYWLGAGHPERARAAMRLGLQMALGLALTCSLLLWLLHLPLARLFAGPNPPVVLLAATLLPWVALYHRGRVHFEKLRGGHRVAGDLQRAAMGPGPGRRLCDRLSGPGGTATHAHTLGLLDRC